MRIEACPKCGRFPVVRELPPNKIVAKRRIVFCPRYCQVIPTHDARFYQTSFLYEGDGDANAVLRNWNRAVQFFKEHPAEKWGGYRYISWTDDPHVTGLDGNESR